MCKCLWGEKGNVFFTVSLLYSELLWRPLTRPDASCSSEKAINIRYALCYTIHRYPDCEQLISALAYEPVWLNERNNNCFAQFTQSYLINVRQLHVSLIRRFDSDTQFGVLEYQCFVCVCLDYRQRHTHFTNKREIGILNQETNTDEIRFAKKKLYTSSPISEQRNTHQLEHRTNVTWVKISTLYMICHTKHNNKMYHSKNGSLLTLGLDSRTHTHTRSATTHQQMYLYGWYMYTV